MVNLHFFPYFYRAISIFRKFCEKKKRDQYSYQWCGAGVEIIISRSVFWDQYFEISILKSVFWNHYFEISILRSVFWNQYFEICGHRVKVDTDLLADQYWDHYLISLLQITSISTHRWQDRDHCLSSFINYDDTVSSFLRFPRISIFAMNIDSFQILSKDQ